MKTLEKKQRNNGSGETIWNIQVINSKGTCVWIHTFKTENEADNWIKYAY